MKKFFCLRIRKDETKTASKNMAEANATAVNITEFNTAAVNESQLIEASVKKYAARKYAKKLRLLKAASVIAVLLVSFIAALNTYSSSVNRGLADNLLRFHVIANSNSEADQAMKIDVRDAVNSEIRKLLKDSENIEQTKSIIMDNMDRIEQVALDQVKKYNKDYPVKLLMGRYLFPTKVYGDVTLPAGEYQALRIVIGNGEGENWWCVLFPPLCFVDATHGEIPDSVKEDLKNVLSEEEYTLITSASDEEDIPVRIRFKIVEIFERSKGKIAEAFASLFQN